MLPINTELLLEAVHHWLSFQTLCGRTSLLNERYLSQPILEYIHYNYNGVLRCETNHPNLQPKRIGRPRQIDFTLNSKNKNEIEVAIESKWVSDSSYSKHAIISDLLRLECIRQPSLDVKRYFLIGGKSANYTKHFEYSTYQAKQSGVGIGLQPFTERYLDNTKDTKHSINIQNEPPELRKYFFEFYKEYGAPIPTGIATQLIKRISGANITIALWQIHSKRGKRTEIPDATAWSRDA